MINDILKDIFENAKDGDCIGFLASGIKKLPIEIATGGACTHCGIIWNVKRDEYEMSFNFSEQTFTGGKFDSISILKKVKNKTDVLYSLMKAIIGKKNNIVKEIYSYDIYKNDSSFKRYEKFYESEKVYFKQLKEPLTEEQKQIGLKDANFEKGKRYGYLSLILGFEFLEKIMPNFFKKRLIKYTTHKRVCSTHCALQYKKMKLISEADYKKDFYYTPIEIMNLNIFK